MAHPQHNICTKFERAFRTTPHGNNLRGSLCGPKIMFPHNYPTRILYPSNFLTMLFVFSRPPTNIRAVTPLIYRVLPIPHNLLSNLFTPTNISRYLLPPPVPHQQPHHTTSRLINNSPKHHNVAIPRLSGFGTAVPSATST